MSVLQLIDDACKSCPPLRFTQVCQEIRDAGGEATVITADCSKRDEIHTMFQQAIDQYGKVDVLVNNAGIARDGLVVRMRPEQWQQVRMQTIPVQIDGVVMLGKMYHHSTA
jgi:NAD(P)-dependent dehydrogenase (short-subunit alcohol dehydrogenase family)